jgi:hypothetical protein
MMWRCQQQHKALETLRSCTTAVRGNLFSLFKEQFKLNLSRNFILKNKQDENRLCPFFSRCRVSLPSCFPPGKKRDSLFISFD